MRIRSMPQFFARSPCGFCLAGDRESIHAASEQPIMNSNANSSHNLHRLDRRSFLGLSIGAISGATLLPVNLQADAPSAEHALVRYPDPSVVRSEEHTSELQSRF